MVEEKENGVVGERESKRERESKPERDRGQDRESARETRLIDKDKQRDRLV